MQSRRCHNPFARAWVRAAGYTYGSQDFLCHRVPANCGFCRPVHNLICGSFVIRCKSTLDKRLEINEFVGFSCSFLVVWLQ